MKKLFIFLMVSSLIFMSVAPSVFGAYANVGPTTEFQGDVGTTGVFKINGTALALSDLTTSELITEGMLDAVAGPADEDILTYETDSSEFEWHTLAEAGIQTAISGSDTHVMFFDGANTPAGDAALTYNTGTDTLTSVTFAGNLTGNADTVTVDDTTSDATCFILLGESDSGSLIPQTDATLTYDASTGLLFATIITGEIRLESSDADPDTTSEIRHDSTVASMAGGALRWKDDNSVRVLVDLETDAVEGDDDKVVAYDWSAKGFYMKADADSGTADWDDIGPPSGADEIDFGGYTIELNVEDFRIGDGGSNYVKFADNGVVTFEGTSTITLPNDVVTAVMIDSVGAGTNLTWNAGTDELDVDDAFILHAGDISTGVHDFGGADSFEIPNKDADPANTGELILDTSVADMTNGNLAFFDGVAIRYVVSLAAADIWSADNYVVAYSASSDKFFMKEDTFGGNFVEHFMDVLPEVVAHCHAQMAGTEGLQEISGALTNPDVPRNLSVTYGTVGSSTGDVTITGLLADGTEDSETFAISGGDETIVGVKAFATVTEISIPATFYATTTIDVGLDNLLGLVNNVDAGADVYKGTLDGVDYTIGTVNTTNNTIDCGTIAANSDYIFRYHN